MTIDTQLYLVTGGLTVGILFVAWQSFQLRTVYRSRSALIGALSFLALGGKQAYGLVRLRANLAEARQQGMVIEHLTLEQWLVGIVWAYLIVIGFIIWMHLQHRDLKRLGV